MYLLRRMNPLPPPSGGFGCSRERHSPCPFPHPTGWWQGPARGPRGDEGQSATRLSARTHCF